MPPWRRACRTCSVAVPRFGPTTAGLGCRSICDAVVDTKLNTSSADTPATRAVIVAGPAKLDDTVKVAVPPTMLADAGVTVPRVVDSSTSVPAGMPLAAW
jgi:hypothetical protein